MLYSKTWSEIQQGREYLPHWNISWPGCGLILLRLELGRMGFAEQQVVEQQWGVGERQQRLLAKEACRTQAWIVQEAAVSLVSGLL